MKYFEIEHMELLVAAHDAYRRFRDLVIELSCATFECGRNETLKGLACIDDLISELTPWKDPDADYTDKRYVQILASEMCAQDRARLLLPEPVPVDLNSVELLIKIYDATCELEKIDDILCGGGLRDGGSIIGDLYPVEVLLGYISAGSEYCDIEDCPSFNIIHSNSSARTRANGVMLASCLH